MVTVDDGDTVAGTEDARVAGARAAFDLVDDGLAVVAVDAEAGYPVVDANPAVARMVGRDPRDVLGRPAG